MTYEELGGDLGPARLNFKRGNPRLDAANRLRSMLSSAEPEPLDPMYMAQDEEVLPEEQLTANELKPPREEAGYEPQDDIEKAAWQRIGDVVNYKPSGISGLISGLTEAGNETVGERMLAADQMAKDVIGMKQRDRQKEFNLKNLMWSQEKAEWMRKQQAAKEIAKMQELKDAADLARERAKYERQVGNAQEASKYYQRARALDKQLHAIKLAQAKGKGKDGKPKLGKITDKRLDTFVNGISALEDADRTLGEFIDFYGKHGADVAALREKLGPFTNMFREIRNNIKRKMSIENLDWAQFSMRYAADLSAQVKSMSGVAVSPEEYKRLERALPKPHGDPTLFIKTWKQIMAERVARLDKNYKIADAGTGWEYVQSLRGDYEKVAKKYRGKGAKPYDPNKKFVPPKEQLRRRREEEDREKVRKKFPGIFKKGK